MKRQATKWENQAISSKVPRIYNNFQKLTNTKSNNLINIVKRHEETFHKDVQMATKHMKVYLSLVWVPLSMGSSSKNAEIRVTISSTRGCSRPEVLISYIGRWAS